MDTVNVNGFRFAKPKAESNRETKHLVNPSSPLQQSVLETSVAQHDIASACACH